MKAESKIQQECVVWFREQFVYGNPEHECQIFSVPNEGKNVREQAAKVSTGLLSGVSDLIVVMYGCVLFIEVKDEKGTQSPNQIKFENLIKRTTHFYEVVRSKEEFQEIISHYSPKRIGL